MDAAGNQSAASASTTFTLDTSPTYATPVWTVLDAAQNGVSKLEIDNSTPVLSYTLPGKSAIAFTITDRSGNSYDDRVENLDADAAEQQISLLNGYPYLDGLITVTGVVSSLAGRGIGSSAPGSTRFVLDITEPTLAAATIAANRAASFLPSPRP